MPKYIKKTAPFSAKSLLLTTALITSFAVMRAAGAQAAVPGMTTPTGEKVVAGSATFSRPAAGQLDVTQSSDRAVINWNNFDIGAKATTDFAQPSATSLAVNRVTGSSADPAHIMGTLTSNGQLMIIDKNGVVFGKNSTVNVGGLLAAAGTVKNSDIMNGNATTPVTITNANPAAVVSNQGNITVADAGLVALVAPTVKNSGTITAKLGQVQMAGGNKVTVDMFGDGLISVALNDAQSKTILRNSGKILAEGGTVRMTTGAAKDIVSGAINNSGIVDVSSVTVKGGKIILSGNANVTDGGTMDAQGAGNGGQVKITGHTIKVPGTITTEAMAAATGTGTGTGTTTGTGTGTGTTTGTGTGTTTGTGTGTTTGTGTGTTTGTGTGTGTTQVSNNDDSITIRATNSVDISGTLNANGDMGGGKITIKGKNVNLANISSLTADSTNVTGTGTGTTTGTGTGTTTGTGTGTTTGTGTGTTTGTGTGTTGVAAAAAGSGLNNGGTISLTATKSATLGGNLSAVGDSGGAITVNGQNIASMGKIAASGNGTEAFVTGGPQTGGTGGTVDMTARQGVAINAPVTLTGQNGGGQFTVKGQNVTMTDLIDTTSAMGAGGNIGVTSTGDTFITGNGGLNAGGSQNGGAINVSSRDLTLGSATKLNASAADASTLANAGVINLNALRSAELGGAIDTTAQNGGGAINANAGLLNVSGNLDASSLSNGAGGNIALTGTTGNTFSGTIASRGGATAGNGGNVALSTPNTLTGTADVTSATGTAGTFTH